MPLQMVAIDCECLRIQIVNACECMIRMTNAMFSKIWHIRMDKNPRLGRSTLGDITNPYTENNFAKSRSLS